MLAVGRASSAASVGGTATALTLTGTLADINAFLGGSNVTYTTALNNDGDVNLTVTEYNIVHRLIEQAGDYVSYRAIYDCVHRAGFIAGNQRARSVSACSASLR